MNFRSLDEDGDWTFGAGLQNYAQGQTAVGLSIQTRVLSFLNDCFFAPQEGIDWFNLLGSKNEAALVFSVRSIILNTPGVNSLTDLYTTLDADRHLTLAYSVATVYGASVTASIVFPVTPFDGISKFISTVSFDGTTTFMDVDVSSHISDAREAIWMLYDLLNGGSPVVGAVTPINATTVRITISPAPTGTFRLVGIS